MRLRPDAPRIRIFLSAAILVAATAGTGRAAGTGDSALPAPQSGIDLGRPAELSSETPRLDSANDPPGLIGRGRLSPIAHLAARLSTDRSWMTAEVMTALDRLALGPHELFDSAPKLFSKDGRFFTIRIEKVGDLWNGFDVLSDPYFVYLTHELYSDLGDDRVLGFLRGEEKDFFERDFARLPAVALAVTEIGTGDVPGRPGPAVEVGEPFELGSPRLAIDRGRRPPPARAVRRSPALKSQCIPETAITCDSQRAVSCTSGASPYFVLSRLLITKDGEGLFMGHPEVELFVFSGPDIQAGPSQEPSTPYIFSGRTVADAAGRSRYLPDVNNTYQWYNTDGVALVPILPGFENLSLTLIMALIEDDNKAGVLKSTESTTIPIKLYSLNMSVFNFSYSLGNLGFLKLLIALKNLFFGDGDDLFKETIATNNALACSSGLGKNLLTLTGTDWVAKGYFACVDPACPLEPPPECSELQCNFQCGGSGTCTASGTCQCD